MSRRPRVHTHPCAGCQTPVFCHGEQVENYDGFPLVICTEYHEPGGGIAAVWCAACDGRDDVSEGGAR